MSTLVLQLFKAERYTTRTYLRKIQKPVDGSVTVWRTRSAVESVITPSIDATTGLVTDTGHVAGDTYAWAGEFDVPCEFVDDTMENAAQIGADGGLFIGWDSIPIQELRNPLDASFFEERFPDSIAQGATGGPKFKTTRNYSGSGERSANRDWPDPLHVFNMAQAIQTLDDFDLVRQFYYVVGGGADGFRVKDFSNYVVSKDRGVMVAVP